MKVRFKDNTEPCIQYHVTDTTEVIDWNNQLQKYCPMIKLEVMGLVPKEILIETNHPDNIDAIDLAIELTNNEPSKLLK